MLKWMPLALANLGRHPTRTALTVTSIALAFVLFAITEAIRSAFAQPAGLSSVHRLTVTHRLGITEAFPFAHYPALQSMIGVQDAVYFRWINSIFGPKDEHTGLLAVDAESLLKVYPELQVSIEARDLWVRNRRAALVGSAMARKFGITAGQRIVVRTDGYLLRDGGSSWELEVAGVYEVAEHGYLDLSTIFVRYDYFNETLLFGRDSINWITLRITDPKRGGAVVRMIDEHFANSTYATKTVSESVGGEQFLRQVGNVGAALTGIAAVILASMFMVVASNLAQSVQERRVEIGVLKAIGCNHLQVLAMVLGESVALMLVGAVIGLAVAATIIAFLQPIVQEYFPVFAIGGNTILIGFALGAGIGIFAGLWPAARALRLSISAALAKDGGA